MSDLRRELLLRAEKDIPGALPEALSAPTVQTLNHLVKHVMYYDASNPKLPDDYRRSYRYQWLKTQLESQLVWDAGERGHVTRMRGVAGRPNQRLDATGYDKLMDDLRPAAHSWIVKGPKGSGKTVKVLDVAKKALENGIVEKVMLNIETKGVSDDYGIEHTHDVRFSELISEMLEFAKEPGEKLLIIDEASTVLNMLGGGHDAQKIFTKVINALRKSAGGSTRLIIVGHKHDTDILPTLRNNADIVLEAEGKLDEGLIDKASVYEGYQAFKKGKPKYRVQGLQDLPKNSSWAVDTNFFAHVELDLDNPDEQIRRGKLIDNWRDYQESEHPEEEQDNPEPEEVVTCAGTNKRGEPCGMTGEDVLPNGYCQHHQNQAENGKESTNDEPDPHPLETVDADDIDWDATGMDAVREMSKVLDVPEEDIVDDYVRAAERVAEKQAENDE